MMQQAVNASPTGNEHRIGHCCCSSKTITPCGIAPLHIDSPHKRNSIMRVASQPTPLSDLYHTSIRSDLPNILAAVTRLHLVMTRTRLMDTCWGRDECRTHAQKHKERGNAQLHVRGGRPMSDQSPREQAVPIVVSKRQPAVRSSGSSRGGSQV